MFARHTGGNWSPTDAACGCHPATAKVGSWWWKVGTQGEDRRGTPSPGASLPRARGGWLSLSPILDFSTVEAASVLLRSL